jgi:hypothetical protein
MGKLIMMLIVALAIGMTIPRTRAMIEEEVKPLVDHFKVKITAGRLKAMADELAVRVERGEGYPPDWSGWLEMDFSGDPIDLWGHQYFMTHSQDGFTVGSNGPDGIRGTADDLEVKRDLTRH